MKIRDIVNRDIVNLDNCEQEPIHIPGSIQPNGFLIAVAMDSFAIEFCSGNVDEFLGVAHGRLLGQSFAGFFGADADASLRRYMDAQMMLSSTPLELKANNQVFLCAVHASGSFFILEGEPLVPDERSLPDTYEQTKQFLTYMGQTHSLIDLCALVAQGTREITGYDRVMIYRFDEQYNGEVVAESVREDLEPFLGLHYPHTDIPPQARELYMKNLLRIITDINYTPVPIYTIDDGSARNLDLGLAVLRSTSPIHVQYLQNMGVGATLTISLIHQGRLWGLIACHHYSAKNLPHPLRIAAQLQGHFITSQIDVRQINEQFDVARKANDALEKLTAETLGSEAQHFQAIAGHPYILDLCNANGVCICVDGELYTSGSVPSRELLHTIIAHMEAAYKKTSFHSSFLSSALPEVGEVCDSAAGLLYHSLSMLGNDCIIWFRGETLREVNWGGDPKKAIVKDEKGLHPRKSFALWKEIVKCRSKAWADAELNTAANYAHSLQKHVTYLALVKEEERYRKLSEVLRDSNSELENINWISTHDLQEPLRKIQMMASRVLAAEDNGMSAKASDLVTRMNNAAHRMQTLLKDILTYTKVRSDDSLFAPVDLSVIVGEVIHDHEDAIAAKRAELVVGDLPTIDGVAFLLRQLFSNLVNNALKFTDHERPQKITITHQLVGSAPGEEPGPFHRISVADTGIGFDKAFSESIFKIFSRLHNREVYDGSGVGLALTRKIMQTHNGYITATGTKGEGACFQVYFPVKQEGKL